MDESLVPSLHIPISQESFGFPGYPPQTSPQPWFDMSLPGNAAGKNQSTAAQYKYYPLVTPINPFFPPLNLASPSPHKRQRNLHSREEQENEARPISSSENCERNDVFAEIHAAVCLEIIKTRYLLSLFHFRLISGN